MATAPQSLVLTSSDFATSAEEVKNHGVGDGTQKEPLENATQVLFPPSPAPALANTLYESICNTLRSTVLVDQPQGFSPPPPPTTPKKETRGPPTSPGRIAAFKSIFLLPSLVGKHAAAFFDPDPETAPKAPRESRLQPSDGDELADGENTREQVPKRRPLIKTSSVLLTPHPAEPQGDSEPAFRDYTWTAVDSLLSDMPSAIHEYPRFMISWLRKAKHGAGGATSFAQLTSTPQIRDGPLVFVKIAFRAEDDLLMSSLPELRAHRRLLQSRTSEGKPADVGADFVFPLDAFIDDRALDARIYIFDVCQGDLLLALNDPAGYQVLKTFQLWAAQMVAGINYLHSIGIIHRDIKPDNVLIDWRCNLRITDLGLAFISEQHKPLDPEQKYAYLSVGTRGYMAPEVRAASPVAYLNNHAADPQERLQEKAIYGSRVDYYSLGVLLYELATLKESSIFRLGVMKTFDFERTRAKQTGSRHRYYNFLAQQGICRDTADLLYELLTTNWRRRAGYSRLYSHPFFINKMTNESMFDHLYEISMMHPQQRNIPLNLYDKKLNLRSLPVPSDSRHGKALWIDPSSKLFQFLR
ncbi:hypothetical protein MD484_g5444, partial [Candolleomyces efflorescens]